MKIKRKLNLKKVAVILVVVLVFTFVVFIKLNLQVLSIGTRQFNMNTRIGNQLTLQYHSDALVYANNNSLEKIENDIANEKLKLIKKIEDDASLSNPQATKKKTYIETFTLSKQGKTINSEYEDLYMYNQALVYKENETNSNLEKSAIAVNKYKNELDVSKLTIWDLAQQNATLTATNSSLNRNIKVIQNNNIFLIKQVEDYQETLEKLKNELPKDSLLRKDLEQQNIHLTKKISRLESNVTNINEDYNKLTIENASKQEIINKQNEKLIIMEKNLTQVNMTNGELISKVAEYSKLNSLNQSQIDELDRLLEKSKIDVTNLDNAINEINVGKIEAQEALLQAQQVVEKTTNMNDNLTAQLSELKNDNSNLTIELSKEQQKTLSQQNEINQINQSLNNYKATHLYSSKEILELVDKSNQSIKNLEKINEVNFDAYKKEIEVLQTTNLQLTAALEKTQTSAQLLLDIVNKNNELISQLKSKDVSALEQIRSNQEQINSIKEGYKVKVIEMQADYDALNNKYLELKAKTDISTPSIEEKNLEAITREINILKALNADLEKSILNLIDFNETYQLTNEKLAQDIKFYQKQVDDLNNIIINLNNTLSQNTLNEEILVQSLDLAKADLDRVIKEKNNYEIMISQKDSTITTMNNEILTLQKLLQEQQQINANNLVVSESMLANTSKDYETQIADLKKNYEELYQSNLELTNLQEVTNITNTNLVNIIANNNVTLNNQEQIINNYYLSSAVNEEQLQKMIENQNSSNQSIVALTKSVDSLVETTNQLIDQKALLEATNVDLNTEILILQKQLQNTALTIDEKDALISEINKQIVQLTSENTSYQMNLDQANAVIADLQLQNTSLAKNLENEISYNNLLVMNINNLNQENENLQAVNNQLSNTVSLYDVSNEELRKKVEEYEKVIEELNTNDNATIVNLSQQLSDYTALNMQLDQQVMDLTNQINNLEQMDGVIRKDLELKVNDLVSTVLIQQETINLIEDENQELIVIAENQQIIIDQYMQDLLALKEAIKNNDEQKIRDGAQNIEDTRLAQEENNKLLVESNQKFADLSDSFVQLQNENYQTQLLLDESQKTITALENEIEVTKEVNFEHINSLTADIDSIKAQNENLNNALIEIEEKYAEELQSSDLLQKQIDNYSNQITQNMDYINYLETIVDQKDEEISQLKLTIKQAKESLEISQASYDKLKGQLDSSESNLKNLEATVSALNEEVRLVSQRNNEVAAQNAILIDTLNSQYASEQQKQGELDEMIISLTALKNQNTNLSATITELNYTNDLMNQQLEDKNKQIEQLIIQLTNYQLDAQNNIEIQRQLNNIINTQSALISDLQSSNNKLTQQVNALQENKISNENLIDTLTSDLMIAEAELETSQIDNSILASKISAIEANFDLLNTTNKEQLAIIESNAIEIDGLNIKSKDLEEEVEGLKQKVTGYIKVCEEANKVIATLEADNTTLINDYTNLNTINLTLNEQINFQKEENAKLNDELDQKDLSITGLNEQLINTNSQLEDVQQNLKITISDLENTQLNTQILSNELISFKAQLDVLQYDNNFLKDSLASNEETKNKLVLEVKDMSNQINMLNTEIYELQIALANEKVTNEQLNATINDLKNIEQQLIDTSLQLSESQVEVNQLNTKYNSLVEEKENLARDNAQYYENINDLNVLLANEGKSNLEKQTKINELSSQFDDIVSKNIEYKNEVEELKNYVVEAEISNTELKNNVVTLAENEIALTNKITELNEIIRHNDVTNSELAIDINSKTQEIKDLNYVLEQNINQINDLKETDAERLDKINELTSNLEKLQILYDDMDAQNKSLVSFIETKDEIISSNDNQIKYLKELEEVNQNKINELEVQINEARLSNEANEKESKLKIDDLVFNYEKQLRNLNETNAMLSQIIESDHVHREELLEYTKKQDESLESLRVVNDNLELEKIILQSQIKTLNEQNISLQTQVNDYKVQLENLTNSSKQTKQSLDDVTKNLASKTDENIKISQELKVINDKNQQLTEQIETATKSIEDLKIKLTNSESNRLEMTNSIVAYQTTITNLKNTNDELTRVLAQKDATIADLNKQLSTLSNNFTVINSQLDTANAQVNTLKTNIEVKNQDINALNATIVKNNSQITSLSTQNSSLTSELNTVKTQNENLIKNAQLDKQTISNLNTEILDLKNQVSSLKVQNESLNTEVIALRNSQVCEEDDSNYVVRNGKFSKDSSKFWNSSVPSGLVVTKDVANITGETIISQKLTQLEPNQLYKLSYEFKSLNVANGSGVTVQVYDVRSQKLLSERKFTSSTAKSDTFSSEFITPIDVSNIELRFIVSKGSSLQLDDVSVKK